MLTILVLLNILCSSSISDVAAPSNAITVVAGEICDNGIDDDGDGLIDCADADCTDCADACSDADGDGVSDFCDLDIDNDGLPNEDEGMAPYGPASGSWNSNGGSGLLGYSTANGHDATYFQGSTASTAIGSGVIAELGGIDDFPEDAVNNTVTSVALYGANSNSLAQAYADNDYIELSIATSATLPAHSYLTGFRYGQYRVVSTGVAVGGVFRYALAVSPDGFTTSTTELREDGYGSNGGDELIYQNAGTVIRYQQFDARFPFYALAPATTYSIRIYVYGDANGDALVNLDDIMFGVVQFEDCDGDGVTNAYDLDSDNDGLLDLFEAGHVGLSAAGDGRIAGAQTNSGGNGLLNALETSTDSDNLNYTPADSEAAPDGLLDACELDADADGCSDVHESIISDPDADGVVGTGTASVTASGLVTGHSYSPPANSNWQSLGATCPELCDNGLDDDGDGFIDCADDACPGAYPVSRVEDP